MVFPRLLAAAASTRTEQTVRENRAALTSGIAQIVNGFRAGQTSLGAAREDEERVRDRFLEALAHFRSEVQDTQSATDLPQIKKAMGEFLSHLDDAVHDTGVRRDEWDSYIRGIE